MSGARGCRTTRGLRHGSGHGSGPAFLSPKRNSPPPFFSSKLVCLLSLTLQNCFNLFTPGSLEAFIPAGRSGGFLRRSEGPDARSPGSRHQRHARLAAQLANDHGVCRSAQSRQQLHVTSPASGDQRAGTGPAAVCCRQRGDPADAPTAASGGEAGCFSARPCLPLSAPRAAWRTPLCAETAHARTSVSAHSGRPVHAEGPGVSFRVLTVGGCVSAVLGDRACQPRFWIRGTCWSPRETEIRPSSPGPFARRMDGYFWVS